jgi:amidohydrolase
VVPEGTENTTNELIMKQVSEETGKFQMIYRDLHSNPELSGMEVRTAGKMAEELRSMGLEVTTSVGGTGVVGVFRNGKGKVMMLRADMDALPIRESTGLPYASKVVMKNLNGDDVPVMHACGHDMHMTIWLGTIRTLVSLKDKWDGTLVAVAQPAEEIAGGASRMLQDGLFKRFPRPDYAFAYHVSPNLPAGSVGYSPDLILAGVNSVDITVYGSGGHGAMPHTTIDPVVLAARIILDIQTIVSREIDPVKPAVITVGSIHGGTKHNIIPDEVRLQLTVRFFEDKVYMQIKEALLRITKNLALSAGLPEEKAPLVRFGNEYLPPVVNNTLLVNNVVSSMSSILGREKMVRVEPGTGAEDFGVFGRTEEKVPIALFWIGSVNHDLYKQYLDNRAKLPPLHNSSYCPDFEPTFTGGVSALSKAVMDLLGKK